MSARSETDAGFTIVETLIFLAISGLMFALAINAMSGKQQQTEFDTGVDNLQADLNQTLSSVADGNYLSLDNITACSANPSGGPPQFNSIAGPPGSCTIIGEVIEPTATSLDIYPVIGRNYEPGTTDIVTDIADALPVLSSSVMQSIAMPFQLAPVLTVPTATTIYPGSIPGSFGIFSFTGFNGANSASGSSHIEIFAIPGSTYNVTPTLTGLSDSCGADYPDQVCLGTNYEPINPSGGITFCVQPGGSNAKEVDSALFTIGGSNSASSATYTVFDKLKCDEQ